MRQNQQYLKCCHSLGNGDLAQLYEIFGDVRGEDFRAWWKEPIQGVDRGAFLFSEPAANTIRLMEEGERAPARSEALTLTVPLNLPKKLLERRFKEFLDTNHKGERGRQLAKLSKALCKVKGQPNIPALALGLKIYLLRKSNPEMPLWEIGNSMPTVLRTQKLKLSDSPELALSKKKALAATVSRILKTVQSRIDRTIEGEGYFP